ncbi:hypothetical protein ACFL20_01705 [Spirochaetota bacterium]
MKKLVVLFVILFVSVSVMSCKKDKHGQMGSSNIVAVGDIQVNFDVMDKKAYDSMMKMMNQKPVDDSKHHIVLTVSDKAKKALVKGAVVTLEVFTPDKKKVIVKANVIEGGNMYHYAGAINMKAAGEYQVKAKIKVKDKVIEAGTSFKK